MVRQLEEELLETAQPGGQTDSSDLQQCHLQLLTASKVRDLPVLPHHQHPVEAVAGGGLAPAPALLQLPHQEVLSHQALHQGGGKAGGRGRPVGRRGGPGGVVEYTVGRSGGACNREIIM